MPPLARIEGWLDGEYQKQVVESIEDGGARWELQAATLFSFDVRGRTMTLSQVTQKADKFAFGSTVWIAAMVILRYLEADTVRFPKADWARRSVLELGSGTGIVGVGMGLLGSGHVTLSDTGDALLQLLRKNVDTAMKTHAPVRGRMSVAPLCWGKNEHEVPPASQSVAGKKKGSAAAAALPPSDQTMIDVLMVCECVYAMDIVVPLITEMERQTEPWLELDGACAPAGDGVQKAKAKSRPVLGPVVLLAMEQRDKAVYDRFWELVSHCFLFDRVPLSDVPADFRTDYVELYIGRRKAGTKGGSGLKVSDELSQEVAAKASEPKLAEDASQSKRLSKKARKRQAAELEAAAQEVVDVAAADEGKKKKKKKKKKTSSTDADDTQ